MHIETLSLTESRSGESRQWSFTDTPGRLRKWTFLPKSTAGVELFGLAALASCGSNHIDALRAQLASHPLFRARRSWQMEFGHIRHAPQERGESQAARRRGGWILTPEGICPLAKADAQHPDSAQPFGAAPSRQGSSGWLLLGYAEQLGPAPLDNRFELHDVHHRLRRCASLFDREAAFTDPVGFLTRLHFKGIVYGRDRSRHFLSGLNRELGPLLGLPPEGWLHRAHDFQRDWASLTPAQRGLGLLVLDVARHVLDASAGLNDPFSQTGVAMFQGVPAGCFSGQLPPCLHLFERLFPQLQFILALPPAQLSWVPKDLNHHSLVIPEPAPKQQPRKPVRLRAGTALLIDVDSRLPNVALMKLARSIRDAGKQVVLARADVAPSCPAAIYASCVFTFPSSSRVVARLRDRYGSDLQLGGSGVDVHKRLPPEIEALDADYSLYPDLGDRAMGFLTRGCPRRCSFCLVPEKEGRPRLVADLDGLLQGRRKLILLDDNLLAHASAPGLLEEMLRRDLQVNFNQTLDLRLLTPETADLVRRVRSANVVFTRRVLHFSLNDCRGLDRFRRNFQWLRTNSGDNIEFVCMYGFNTTLAEDLERFRFLRTLPGAYVFVQRYRPTLGAQEPDLAHFFDERSEQHLDELTQVLFPQNMKSMEVYYRWVCLRYAIQCRRIHRGLVETLFRYNSRHRMAPFLSKLEMICRHPHTTLHETG